MYGIRRTPARILLLLPLVLAMLPDRAANAGYGGVSAIVCKTYWSSCGYTLGTTNAVSHNDEAYFAGSWNTCTHAYPYNDVYFEYAYSFETFTFNGSPAQTNCNRVVLYLDNTQGGGGAVNCYRYYGTCTPGGTFRSISWHNR